MRIIYTLIVFLFVGFVSFAQPVNDDPCNAIEFPTGGTCGEDVIISTVGASTTSAIPFTTGQCNMPTFPTADNAFNDIWYTAFADGSGNIRIEAAVGPNDPVISVYTSSDGTCSGTFNFVGCDDDGGSGLDADLNITGLAANQKVWIRIWEYTTDAATCTGSNCGDEGEFIIRASSGDSNEPDNDDCAAIAADPNYQLALNVTATNGTTFCATTGNDDPSEDCATFNNTVWYSFTPTETGSYLIDLFDLNCLGVNNTLQTVVISGGCSGSRTQHACNDDGSGSSTSFVGEAGTTYHIIVNGESGANCEFSIAISDCSDAGTIAGPAIVSVCEGGSTSAFSTSGFELHSDPDACIVWGLWVAADNPTNPVYGGMSDIGVTPTGAFPEDDANFVGVYSDPAAIGDSPTLPGLEDGVTYYIAPITAADCSGPEPIIDLNCFDVGDVRQIYNNPVITENHAIDCDDNSIPTSKVDFSISGGLASVYGGNLTVTLTGGTGTLSSSTVVDGGILSVSGIPNNTSIEVTVEDGLGCSESFTVGPIDATAYCPFCPADAGS